MTVINFNQIWGRKFPWNLSAQSYKFQYQIFDIYLRIFIRRHANCDLEYPWPRVWRTFLIYQWPLSSLRHLETSRAHKSIQHLIIYQVGSLPFVQWSPVLTSKENSCKPELKSAFQLFQRCLFLLIPLLESSTDKQRCYFVSLPGYNRFIFEQERDTGNQILNKRIGMEAKDHNFPRAI